MPGLNSQPDGELRAGISYFGSSHTPVSHHLALPFVLLLALSAAGQTPTASPYKLELLSMIRSDSTRGRNDIQASILVTPVDMNEWPPLLSMRVGIRINEQDSTTYLPLDDGPGPDNVRLILYDKSTIAEKNAKLHARIGPQLDAIGQQENLILWFQFRDISEEVIRQMAITYGPWEKNNNDKRIEETFTKEFKD